jgi:uncharacterized membrane protein YphA (DoxX/SURF4 family)
MNKSLREQIFTGLDWTFRLLLAGLFLYAAWPKLLDPEGFARSITNYKLSLPVIGQDYVYLSAMFLPALEAVAAVCLFISKLRRGAALTFVVLLSVFTVLILQAGAARVKYRLRMFWQFGCFGGAGDEGRLDKDSREFGLARRRDFCVSAVLSA